MVVIVLTSAFVYRNSEGFRHKDGLEAHYLVNKGHYSYKTILGER